jgi:nucleoside-diphosphate-sugar epimerase
MKHLLCFGFGFSASTLAARLDRKAWRVTGTSRSNEGVAAIEAAGFEGVRFDQYTDIPRSVTHIVSSVPPGAGDPVIEKFGAQLAKHRFDWVAYLSTTGVYGDHQGRLVDEEFPLTPNTERGEKRVTAEAQWLRLHQDHGVPVHVFRLAGIYGPGRNQLLTVRDGTAKRVIKAGQVFSRIHVEDIAGVMLASMARPKPGRAYNVADDEPCPPQDVVAYAAGLLGVEPPPEIPFEEADLSPMARSFFADSKRVSNARVKTELGYVFKYLNYRVGLKSLL